jgi:magnesium-dependent phosphatase 1
MLPRCLVFDLDGCVWDPEMYELWGGGGAPFKPNKDGTLSDKAGPSFFWLKLFLCRDKKS